MKLRTVKDLKIYLKQEKLSPESFANLALISNMTIRRLMLKPTNSPLPVKYHATFDQVTLEAKKTDHFLPNTDDFLSLVDSLEEAGKGEHDLNQIKEELGIKSKNPHVCKKLVNLSQMVYQSIMSNQISKKDKLLAIGAILYFLNPIDLIPDTMVGVGFLDDYAVLSMVAARLVQSKKVNLIKYDTSA